MTIIHTTAMALSAIIFLAGSSGFLRKKLSFWAFFVFCWLAISLFAFGILPTQFPDWALGRQVIYSIFLSIASFLVVGLLLKYILAKKEKK